MSELIPATIPINAPTEQELATRAEAAYKDATDLVPAIDSDEMRDVATEERNRLRGMWNALEKQRTEITGPLLKAKQSIDALFKRPMERIEAARLAIDNAILTYNDKQRKEAERKQRELEAAAEAERKRLAKEAEEAAKAAQQLELAATQATDAAEAERLMNEAAAKQQAAQQAEMTQAMVVAPSAMATATKMTGAAERKTVDYEVLDMVAFLKWLTPQLDSAPHLASLVVVDSIKMRAQAQTYGEDPVDDKGTEQRRVPGVRFFTKRALATARGSKKAA